MKSRKRWWYTCLHALLILSLVLTLSVPVMASPETVAPPTSPSGDEGQPQGPAQPPVDEQTPPSGDEGQPQGPAQPPADEQTPPGGNEGQPQGPAQPPTDEQTPPSGNEGQPQGPGQPPVNEQTPPSGNESQPQSPTQPPLEGQTPPNGNPALPLVPAQTVAEPFDPMANGSYIPGQILVRYRSDAAKLGAKGAMMLATAENSAVGSQVQGLEPGADVDAVLEQLRQDPTVEFAEPNYIAKIMNVSEPNDPEFTEQWGLAKIGAPLVWPMVESAPGPVVVAVVDTGVKVGHEDLVGRVLPGRNFADFMDDGNPYPSQDNTNDDYGWNGHGTQVAGIIAATHNNGLGISGVAGPANVKVLPVKVLNDDGWGTVFDIAEGIRWAADQPGVAVINLSLGVENYSHTLADAVKYAQEKGILVVASAGNINDYDVTIYPGAYPGVLTVGSITEEGEDAWYSHGGEALDIMAPGQDIWSTTTDSVKYYQDSGTSFAAPHVSAVAALYRLLHPDATGAEIADRLTQTAEDMGEDGWDRETGFGVLDAAAALGVPIPATTAIAFASPVPEARITGQARVAVQAVDPERVDRVSFYLDNEALPANLLEQVDRTDGAQAQTNYSFVWDTIGTLVTDGSHTLKAQAYKAGSLVGGVISLPVSVNNAIANGLLLQILDPAGAPAMNADVMIYQKHIGSEDEIEYREVFDLRAGQDGKVRIPAADMPDLRQYEVIVVGEYDVAGHWEQYVYHRSYESPQSDTIDGSRCATVDFSMKDLDNHVLPHAGYILRPIDTDGLRLPPLETFVASPEGTFVLHLDRGLYDAFAFWSPTWANQQIEGDVYDLETDTTYFLAKPGLTIASSTNLCFDTIGTGQVKPIAASGQSDLHVNIWNDDYDDVINWPVELSTYSGLVVTPGDYELGFSVGIASSSSRRWTYSFKWDTLASVTPGSVTSVQCAGPLAVEFEPLDAEISRGEAFYADINIHDARGNRLTGISYYDSGSWWSTTVLPIFQVDNSAGQYTFSNNPSYTQAYWHNAQPAGDYIAKFRVNETGPLNNNQLLDASFAFRILGATEPEPVTIPIRVTGRDGNPVPQYSELRIYCWESYGEDGQEYGYWWYRGFNADDTGTFHLPANLTLDPDQNRNVVVVQANASGGKATGWKRFTSLQEIDGMTLAGTVPVTVTVSDNTGAVVVDNVGVGLDLCIEADGNPETKEYLGHLSGSDTFFLMPGDYRFVSSFSASSQGIGDHYVLISDLTSVTNQPASVQLKGELAAHVTFETGEDYQLGWVSLWLEGANYYDYFYNQRETHLYLSAGTYIPTASIARLDPEPANEWQKNAWVHLLQHGEEGVLTVEDGQPYRWQLGGPFTIDLDLDQNALTLEDTLSGRSIVRDSFGNRQIDLTTELIGAAPSAVDPDAPIRSENPLNRYGRRLPDGSYHRLRLSLTQDWGDYEYASPFLRIYRQEAQSETRVFNREDDDYYWGFDEDLGEWGTSGRYRAELAIGIGPEGPIKTGTTEKYYFTIGNAQERPIITVPANGRYLNTRAVVVSGSSAPGASVQIYLYQTQPGELPSATVVADSNGEFSGEVVASGDGGWKLMAKLAQSDPSEEVSVTIDTLPPNPPTLNAALGSDLRSVVLTLSGEPGEDVTFFVERDGRTLVDQQSGTTYTDSTTQRGTTYSYTAGWVDKAGNRSALSAPVSITIPAGLQTASVSYRPSPSGWARIGQTITVAGRGTAGMRGKATALLQPGGRTIEFDLAEPSSGFYQGTVLIEDGTTSIDRIDIHLEDDTGATPALDALNGHPVAVGATLSGTIVRTNRGPVANLSVKITPVSGHPDDRFTVFTDSDGAYRVDGLTPGGYTVQCNDPVLSDEHKIDVQLLAGTLQTSSINLFELYQLTVLVVDKDDSSKPIAGLPIDLSLGARQYRQKTATSGSALFTDLPAGDYQWSTDGAYNLPVPYLDQSGVLTVPASGGAHTIELASRASLTEGIYGLVTDLDGIPLPGATVSAWSWSNYNAYKTGHTGFAVSDDLGEFRIEGLLPGLDYQVTYDHPGYREEALTGQVVEQGRSTKLADMKLDKMTVLTGVIKGKAIAGTDPLGEIPLTVIDSRGARYYVRTDLTGRYTVKNLNPGRTTISASGAQIGYGNFATADYTVTVDQINELDIELLQLGVIEGTVTDSQGHPKQFVYVSASGPKSAGTRTDTQGKYYLRGLTAGAYQVTLSVSSDIYDPKTVEISEGARETANFQLRSGNQLLGPFSGPSSYFSVSTDQTAPGQTLSYVAAYRNYSAEALTHVNVTLKLPDRGTLVVGSVTLDGVSLQPQPVVANGAIVVPIGDLAPGASGRISYRVQVDSVLTDDAILTASSMIEWVSVNGAQSAVLGVAQTTVMYTSIVAPSVTADGRIKIYGQTVPGALVRVYDGEQLLGLATVNGRWWYLDCRLTAPASDVNEEIHTLVASASKGDVLLNASKPVEVVYRPSAPIIRDVQIEAGWNRTVRFNPYLGIATMGITERTPFTVRVRYESETPITNATVTWLGQEYPLTPIGDWPDEDLTLGNVSYGMVPMPPGWQVYGDQSISVNVSNSDSPHPASYCVAKIIVLIDPSGFVYEGVESNRVPGVTATLEQEVDGRWVAWDAALFGQVNPQVTDSEGRYGWDVPAGKWRVIFTKPGYESFNSTAVWDGTVPPPKFDLNVGLTSTALPQLISRTPAVNASSVPTGAAIEVEYGKYMQVSSFGAGLTLTKKDTGEVVPGTITGIAKENGLAKKVKFVPASLLDPETRYEVRIDGVRDYTNRTPAVATWTFITGTSAVPQPGQFQIGSAAYSVREDDGSVTVKVMRSGGSDGAVTVDYATADGTARAGSDYTTDSGTLTFAAGEVEKTTTVTIQNDSSYEGNETFTVTLSNPTGGATLGSPATTVVTIVEDDHAPNPGGSGGDPTPSTPPANQIYIIARTGGKLTYAGLTMTVPANALPANATLTILKLAANNLGTLVPAAMAPRLASELYEIRTTGSGDLGEQTITVKLPYDPAKIAQGEQPVIHYYDDLSGEWVALATETVQENGKWVAVARTSRLGKFAVFSTPIPEEPTEEPGEDPGEEPDEEPTEEPRVIQLIIGQSTVHLGDELLELDVQPYVKAGRTLVPLRFISEALGAQVEWYEANQQVIVRRGDQWILLTVGSTRALVSGKPYDLDCAPEVIEPGRTMVPLRFISEVLGAQVDYDDQTGEIRITVPNGD